MFNHRQTLNHAILEGAATISTKYGHGVMMDFLDINWYKDEEWIETFEMVLKDLENGDTKTLLGQRYDYRISIESNFFEICAINQRNGNEQTTKVPSYLTHDLFLLMSTLLKGDYDVSI